MKTLVWLMKITARICSVDSVWSVFNRCFFFCFVYVFVVVSFICYCCCCCCRWGTIYTSQRPIVHSVGWLVGRVKSALDLRKTTTSSKYTHTHTPSRSERYRHNFLYTMDPSRSENRGSNYLPGKKRSLLFFSANYWNIHFRIANCCCFVFLCLQFNCPMMMGNTVW